MAMPPSDVKPSALVAMLTEAPFSSREVCFPRQGMPRVRLRVLESAEQVRADIAASLTVERRYKEVRPEMASFLRLEDAKGSALSAEILFRSCYMADPVPGSDPPQYVKCFSSAAQVEELLTTGEIAQLMAEWVATQNRLLGNETVLRTEAEVTAWSELLKEGLRAYPFLPTDSQARGELACLLSARLSSVLTLVEDCPSETLPTRLASLRETWASGTPVSIGQLAPSDRSTEVTAIRDALTR